jgi:hypothetical protein
MCVARLAVAAIVCLAGCATIRGLEAHDSENLLAAAGFKREPIAAVDTSLVDATPPYRRVGRSKDGTVQYSYADPDGCRCVYRGGPGEYAEYQRLATERRLEEERRQAVEDMWDRDSWGLLD